MDTGSYALSNLRAFGELDVVKAEAEEMAPDVDRRTSAELRYRNGGATASVLSDSPAPTRRPSWAIPKI